MAAPPDSAVPGDGTPQDERPATLAGWLRARSDRDLAQLLRLRPDLALPAPPDITALAARAGVRTSVQRAVDGLDAPALRLLEALVLAADERDAVTHPPTDHLDVLLDLALVWGDADHVQLTPSVRDAVGPYPAGLGRPAAVLFGRPGALADPQQVSELIAQTDAEERDVLDRLAAGPPVGSVRATRPVEGQPPAPAHRLVDLGLLAPLGPQHVELPREVGLVLRSGDGPTYRAEPPRTHLVERTPTELDQLGTTAVLDTIRLLDALADLWTVNPPAVLRAGGVGVRDLRRTARDLGVDEPVAALVVEVGYAAGLINSTNSPEPVFLPSTEFDAWQRREPAQRWLTVAAAWLTMTRQPSLVNQRGDRDRVISALGPDAERGTVAALRRQLLTLLAELPPGSAPASRADVLALLAWQQPRRAAAQQALAQAILDEADQLGVTAAGGVTGYTRTLLAGSAGPAEHALSRALPEPVDHFLVQPDLTVVVPGPPDRAVGAELGLLADLESTGGAHVYRITEATVRRALDAGRTGVHLIEFVESHSRTPLPQALRYMIDDAARRHGRLRSGSVSAYLRCDDEALLARVVSDRDTVAAQLRLIAPTVAVSAEPVARLLDVLRAAGYAPAAEAANGEVVTVGTDPARAPTRQLGRPIVSRSAVGADGQAAELVRRIRLGDEASQRGRAVQSIVAQVPGVTSASTMDLLRRAIRDERLILLGVAQPDGAATAHELTPISLAAGIVRGYERGRSGLASFALHRITMVRLLDEDDE